MERIRHWIFIAILLVSKSAAADFQGSLLWKQKALQQLFCMAMAQNNRKRELSQIRNLIYGSCLLYHFCDLINQAFGFFPTETRIRN